MRLILVRHGETEENVAKTIQGRRPGKLTKTGTRQAEEIARKLKDERIDIIIVSPLKRVVDTADPTIRDHPEAKVIKDDRLLERSFGDLEGMSSSVLGDIYGNARETVDYKPKNGESLRDVYLRARNFLDDMAKRYGDETIAVFSHGGPLTNIILILKEVEFDKRNREIYNAHHPKNAAITVINVKEGRRYEFETLNSIDHLEQP